MRKSDWFNLILLAFVVGCRFHTPLADFYAERLYPVISAALSFTASWLPFSFEEIVVGAYILALLIILIVAVAKNQGFWHWLGKTVLATLSLVVWMYIGWGTNYFRTPLYTRMDVQPASYDERAFSRFLSDYTQDLNGSSLSQVAFERNKLEASIKEFYSANLTEHGYTALRPWQHVKKPLLNPLYSAVGVQGFMGPFFCESQLNTDLREVEVPFTMAHELAHLAGVTSEAEANYWAYTYCRQSDIPGVRYSAYLALLPYVSSSASTLLSEAQYASWSALVSPKAKADYAANREFWESKRVKVIDGIQRWMMDRFLKTNGVTEGAKDYYGVIGMIMTLDAAVQEVAAPTPAPDYRSEGAVLMQI
jgi:hypothetical protein